MQMANVSKGLETQARKSMTRHGAFAPVPPVSKDYLWYKLWGYNRIINRVATQSC